MATRKKHPKLTQLEVQDAMMALIRIAAVWARRSFEDDEPLDRPADEALLRRVVELVQQHNDVPLATATGRTRAALRESSIRDIERYDAIHRAVKDFKRLRNPNARRAQLARAVSDILTAFERPCDLTEGRRLVDVLAFGDAPSVLAGKILYRAGFKSYRSLAEAKRAEPRLREIVRRRETTRLELIEYLLACLQVPEERLHEFAVALYSVRNGGTLQATSSNPTRGRAFGRHVRKPYPRYGAWRIGEPSLGVLNADYAAPDEEEDGLDPRS